MKIVFMGTPDFSARVLEKLNSVYPVYAAVTGLDKPCGRGYKLTPSPLKQKAIKLNIPVLQFDKVSKEGLEILQKIAPDVIVTAAFGQILSDELLSIPFFGVLNVHASLLPKYRGASPIQWAIINGEAETGITIMRTVKEVDAGDILLQVPVKIGDKETAGELFDKLAEVGGKAIVEAIHRIDSEYAAFTPQNAAEATHCKMIKKGDGKIDFSKTARLIDCFVRGMTPWPSAYVTLDGKMLKVYDTAAVGYAETENDASENALSKLQISQIQFKKLSDNIKLNSKGIRNVDAEHKPYYAFGTVLAADDKNGLVVSCADGAVRLKELQFEGGKRMKDVDFLRGHKIKVGSSFNDSNKIY